MRVVIGPDAKKDLEGVYHFLAKVSEKAAAKTHNKILDEAVSLAKRAKSARQEPLLDDVPGDYRSTLVKRNYKIIFKITDGVVYIAAIWNCRRNPEKLKKQCQKLNNFSLQT